jgi:hypothetical protein
MVSHFRPDRTAIIIIGEISDARQGSTISPAALLAVIGGVLDSRETMIVPDGCTPSGYRRGPQSTLCHGGQERRFRGRGCGQRFDATVWSAHQPSKARQSLT